MSLSRNTSAIALLNANPTKINWEFLSMNPNAINLLKMNQDKIKWRYISYNHNIFTNDIKKYNNDINNLQSVLYLINQ